MISKPCIIGLKARLQALAFILAGLCLSASVVTAFPNLHHHSNHSASESRAQHGNGSHEGSGSDAPAPHGHENCQFCLIQSTLGHSIPPTAPDIRFLIQARAFLVLPCASFIPQVLIAGVQSRGPPAFLPV